MSVFDYSLISDPQTRLDRYLETRNGESISADSLSFLFSGDIMEAEYQLRRWEARHPKDCFVIRPNPILVRITMNADSGYNHRMHDKNRRQYR